MSQNLRDSLDAMYDARIPDKWLKVRSTHTHIKCLINLILGLLGIRYIRVLVYGIIGKGRPIPVVVQSWKTARVLDDRLLQSSRIFDGDATRCH